MTEQTEPVPAPVVADRAVGAVLGSAAGDALGAHYEFGPSLPADIPVDMIGGGAFGWSPGEWTDDTQMALAILGVLATGSTDTGEVEAAFRRWYASGPADVGNQTRAVLGRLARLAHRGCEFAPNGRSRMVERNLDAFLPRSGVRFGNASDCSSRSTTVPTRSCRCAEWAPTTAGGCREPRHRIARCYTRGEHQPGAGAYRHQ